MSTPRTNGAGVGSPYISAKKVRGALGETIAVVNGHAGELEALKRWVLAAAPALDAAVRGEAILSRRFWGRLRWLLTGK